MADHLVYAPDTELRHDCTELVGNVIEEVDDMLWCPLELVSENWVLGSYANRTCILIMAFGQQSLFRIGHSREMWIRKLGRVTNQMTIIDYEAIGELKLTPTDLDCPVFAINGILDLERARIVGVVLPFAQHSLSRNKEVMLELR